jgi:hypothetical protein
MIASLAFQAMPGALDGLWPLLVLFNLDGMLLGSQLNTFILYLIVLSSLRVRGSFLEMDAILLLVEELKLCF